METTTDNFSVQEPIVPVRPQMLSVLCILTWICCGLLLVFTIWGVVGKPSAEEQYEQIEKLREVNPEMADKMEAAYQAQDQGNQTVGLALNLIALALSAYGAYMMWQLKKTGFYVYVAAEILPYFGFLTGGSEMVLASMGGPGMAAMVIGVMALFDIIFIILYAVNLKHMRAR
jgi:hypothetical protein